MNKILLLSAIACSVAFYACKKDSNPESTTPVTDTIKTIDPVALSASVKIGYGGTSVKGDLPAASSDANAPILDTFYNNLTYYAISERYIVIKPQSYSGYIAGYYLKINGADNYFKIDYKTAFGARKAQRKAQSEAGQREEGDNADSTIIIKLPANVTGDTFLVKYAAYDTLNRVSNTITAIVSVVASAKSTDNDSLLGSWRLDRERENNDDWYNEKDTSYSYYACVDNKLTGCDEENCLYLPYQLSDRNYTFQFATANQITSTYTRTRYRINTDSSSCSDLKYSFYSTSTSNYGTGGYSYNSANRTLTVVFDENEDGNLYTTTYTVTSLTASKLSMYIVEQYQDSHDQLYVEYMEYIKQ